MKSLPERIAAAITVSFILLALGGCASSLQDIQVRNVSVCASGECAMLETEQQADQLIEHLHEFLTGRVARDVMLAEADPKNGESASSSISYFTLGGPLPFYVDMTSLKFTEVLPLDKDKREVRFRLRPWSSFLAIPVLCLDGEGILKINSFRDVSLEVSNLCSWLLVGTNSWQMKMKLDRIDLDHGTLAGYYSVGHGGPLTFGKGSGYQVARFPSSAASDTDMNRSPAASGAISGPLPADRGSRQRETVQIISRPPRLEYLLELNDANGNKVLEAGEKVVLNVSINNRGEGDAVKVAVQLSGSGSLVSLFGATHHVGNIRSGETRQLELTGILPQSLPSESAELRIELLEENGFAPAESHLLRIATRGTESREVVEIVSELNVDDIPPKVRSHLRPDDLAVVIGIGSYRERSIPQIKYARRDAEVVAQYLENLSGLTKDNIALLTDDNATKSDIEAYLGDWLPRRVKSSSTVYLFFAGHGTPDTSGKGAYIVPYEGHPDFKSKLLPLQQIYQLLDKLPAREVVVFLDSCFSGAQGRSIMQSGVRPLVLTTEQELQSAGKAIVLASASGSEVTSDYDKAKHGLFTFYFLKGLRGEADNDGSGSVTMGELYSFISKRVGSTASLELNRTQTPVLTPYSASERKELEISHTR